MANNNTFYLGLCLAGAVSAGAYTAGVMDYLIEALEEWEKRRGDEKVPSHRVEIPVIGGASAGGMTGIIAASAVNNPIEPVRYKENVHKTKHPENKFYHTWVDLIDEDMFTHMLSNSDISEKKVYSILNSDFIDVVADRVLKIDNNKWIERKYFAKELKVFTSLSNLKGFTFDISFKAGSDEDEYLLSRHSDFACFKLNTKQNKYKNDGWIPLSFKDEINTDIARDAAMATGAFPVGLKARTVTRKNKYVNDNPWFKDITKYRPICEKNYKTINVDGGLINNEPFGKVRELLNEIAGYKNEKEAQKHKSFKSSILLIDPFPSEEEDFECNGELLDVVKSTFSAMLGHIRVKSTDLVNAMNSELTGQYLLSPVAKRNNSKGAVERVKGSKAIACGAMGGFAGFLSKEFRIHDFFLGRANCEKFLRDHFTVPVDTSNPIFEDGYKGADKTKFMSSINGGLQIIPIFTEKEAKKPMPVFGNGKQWPSFSKVELKKFKKPLKSRIQSIVLNTFKLNRKIKPFMWLAAKLLLNKKLANEALDIIKESLKKHHLLSK